MARAGVGQYLVAAAAGAAPQLTAPQLTPQLMAQPQFVPVSIMDPTMIAAQTQVVRVLSSDYTRDELSFREA